MLQLELFVEEGVTTRVSLLAAVKRAAGAAVSGARPPASLVAEAVLTLAAAAAHDDDNAHDLLRALADEVAKDSEALGAPPLNEVWPHDAT